MPLQSAIVAYLHYLSLGIIFASLAIESQTFKLELTLQEARRILLADTLYGLAGIVVFVTGVLRVIYFGKGAQFYTENPIFWLKVGIFVLVGLLSLYPTISYLRWLPKLRLEEAPAISETQATVIKRIIWLELVGFSLIPLTAALMARGIGLPVG